MSKNKKEAAVMIDKLSPEQEVKIVDYVRRFKKIALSTTPTNKKRAESALKELYKYLKRDEPIFVWADDPFEGAKLAAQHAKGATDVTHSEIKDQAFLASYGSFESYWVSFYSFINNEFPINKSELCDIAERIIEDCGVYWTFEGLIVVTKKPTIIEFKGDKLHCDNGPALAYPSGRAIYAIESVKKQSLMEIALDNKYGKTGTN